MPTTAETALVPLSQSLGRGTAGQAPEPAGHPRDKSGAFSLKALVSLVSERDSARDTIGTTLSHAPVERAEQRDSARDTISGAPTPRAASDNLSGAGDDAAPCGKIGHTAAPEPRTEAAPPRVPVCWRPALDALEAAPAPGGWRSEDWRELVEGSRAMLREHGAALEACGWSELELFGLDDASPWRRVDVGAARFLVGGWRVSSVTRGWIRLRTPGGRELVYRRRPVRAGLVLSWKLIP